MEREESEGRKSSRRVFLQLREADSVSPRRLCRRGRLAVRRAEHDTQIYLLGFLIQSDTKGENESWDFIFH